jgi:TonB family protein
MMPLNAVILLFAKITLLLLSALLALASARRATAAMRHMLCLSALAGSLILPFFGLLPASVLMIRVPVDAVAGVRAAAPASGWPWSRLAVTLWLSGSALLLLRLAAGYWQVNRLLNRGTPSRTSAAPHFYADVSVPIVCGLLRPRILMPRSAENWPEPQYRAAIRHELAHIRRKDLWANLISGLACAAYWFHPLVWSLAGFQRREQEAACDDAVIQSGFDPAEYGEALLATARQAGTTLLFGCSMTTQMNVKSRIKRALDRSMARTTSPAAWRRTGIVLAGLFVAIAMFGPARADQVYKVGDGVSAPRVTYKINPDYTQEARDAKISGSVLLSVVVGADGLAHDITVVRGIDPGLDENAIIAVQQWRFAPGKREGEPVAVRAQIEINFRLN